MIKSNDKLLFILTYFVWFITAPTTVWAQSANTMGDLITNTYVNMDTMPGALAVLAYVSGIVLGFNSILDFKKHIENPDNLPVQVPFAKFLGAGFLFSIPYLSTVMVGNLFGEEANSMIEATGRNTAAVGSEVDGMIYNFISNIHAPMVTLITVFAYVSAIVFLMIAIDKMVKMSQDGFKGVPPISVIGNLVVAGALFAFGDMAGVFSTSFFGDATVNTYSVISTDVMSNTEDAERIATVIDAVMGFIALVGLIAFLRGWFVLRDVAEGGEQQTATLSEALTLLIGGTLAINLGELLNILQNTIGIDPTGTLIFQ